MRINQHIPHYARRDPASPFGRMHARVTARLAALKDVVLTVSAHPIRAQDVGPDAFAINYHTRFGRRRNLNLKLGYLPGFLYADRSGFGGWSEVTNRAFDPATINPDEAEHYLSGRIESRIFSRGLTKVPQARSGAVPGLPQGYVLVPLQVPKDIVLRLADVETDAILSALLPRARRQPLVIKLHPETRDPLFVSRINGLHDPAAGVHVVTDHIHDLIAHADRVVTINSGTGLEALLLGKPVITCGKTDYHHLTTAVTSAQGLCAALDAAPVAPDRVTLARYCLWYCRQMVDLSTPDWEDRIIEQSTSP